MNRKTYFHAINLISENCTGCTKCVKVCPTEALRVRDGQVQLDSSRCIDCGNCVEACNFDAILAVSDKLDIIQDYRYKVAVLASSFDGQFADQNDYQLIRRALLKVGFDEVKQESMLTNVMIKIIRDYIKKHPDLKPVISSDCPSIVRLIQVRFPSLLPNLLHIESPLRIMSTYIKEKICNDKELDEKDVGVFQIVPCVAQVTAVHQPEGTYKNAVDGAISIRDIYPEIIELLTDSDIGTENFDEYVKGLGWAITRIQSEEINSGEFKTIAVSGIQNVIEILAKIENQQIDKYDYVVLSNCQNGCIGGILNAENPFIATSRILNKIRNTEHKEFNDEHFLQEYKNGKFNVLPLEPRSILTLDEDIKTALSKMKRIDDISSKLPGLDCSACGSPTCRALAEDIVEDKASMNDCIILLRKHKKR